MLIKVVKEGDLYSAEVTKDGEVVLWRSPRPMPSNGLWLALRSIGCTPEEVVNAFQSVGRPSPYYHWADEMGPQVEEALAGDREVLPQAPFTEAWITYALFWEQSPIPLEDIIGNADAVNVLIPTADEIAWAFLRLKKRGWLVVQGNLYGLTAEGRRSIETIVGKDGGVLEQAERLHAWMMSHPS